MSSEKVPAVMGLRCFISLVTICALLFSSCELKRSNPFENLPVPPRVTGLTAIGSGAGEVNKFVELRWKRNTENTSGYYVYMALAYNAAYVRKDVVGSNVSADEYMIRRISVSAYGHYYFKVSAYVTYPAGDLEGPLSEFRYVFVAN